MMNIENFCKIYDFGNVSNITKLTGGLMHKMFKVETDKGTYCVKVLNPEVMARDTAYNNFVVSESVSNLAKKNNIPVSSALDIDGDYLKEYDDYYYMVFDYVNGKTLKDNEITIEHCKQIGGILGKLHNLDYKEVGLEPNIVEYKRLYNWEEYTNNPNFNNMFYKELFLNNYLKFNSMLKRANERFNESNINQTLCHSDMDPKNVMWNGLNPIVIDWECAGVANPERELLEDALCWSGFLSNKFDQEKFIAIFDEYSKYRSISDVDWYDVICGNLVGRFGWLKYNVERSLGIVSNDLEEMKLAENEVIKTIDEINRYLGLIGTMDDILCKLVAENSNSDYTDVVNKIVEINPMLQNQEVRLINAGFTNTIYSIGDYIIRICSSEKNEQRFKNEMSFYEINQDNDQIPKMYVGDSTKAQVPYMYEIIEKIKGEPLYNQWYKMNINERKNVINKLVEALKKFHLKEVEDINFSEVLKNRISHLQNKSSLPVDLFDMVKQIAEDLFTECKCGYIHGDLHFDNVMYDDDKLSILDFERSLVGPIDYDFRILAMCEYYPWKWASASTDMITVESDYQGLMKMILDNYEELRNIPNIEKRLNYYLLLEMIDHHKNTKDENIINDLYDRAKSLTKSKTL